MKIHDYGVLAEKVKQDGRNELIRRESCQNNNLTEIKIKLVKKVFY